MANENPSSIPAPKIMRNVHEYVVKGLTPVQEELLQLWEDAAEVRGTSFEALTGRRTRRVVDRHRSLSGRVIAARRKAVWLDEWIDPNDPDGMQKLHEYMAQPVIREFVEAKERAVATIMRDVTESIRGLRMEVDFRRSGLLATTAIILAAISGIVALIAIVDS